MLNFTVPTTGLTITRNVAFGPRPDQRLDIYQPKNAAAGLPLVVFFYGGGWHGGKRGRYLFVAASLARTGMVVLVPDYRLYPAVTFPDFLRDSAAAVAWAQAHQPSLGGGGVFLMGHSAGAYNAVMVGLDERWLREAGGEPAQIRGIIGMAGPYDFTPTPDVAGSFPDPGPQIQPVNYVRADAPPLLLLSGADDTVVKPRNSLALAAREQVAGGRADVKIFPGLGHIGLVTALAPAFRWRAPVLAAVTDFVAAHAAPAN